jgi:hypothetical protein
MIWLGIDPWPTVDDACVTFPQTIAYPSVFCPEKRRILFDIFMKPFFVVLILSCVCADYLLHSMAILAVSHAVLIVFLGFSAAKTDINKVHL